jgi:hypothetical protein
MRRVLAHIGMGLLSTVLAVLGISVIVPAPRLHGQVPNLAIPVPNNDPFQRFKIEDSETLSSSGDFLVLQEVANGPQIFLRQASIYCASKNSVSFYRNASISGGSHPPIHSLNGGAPRAVAWLGIPMTPPGTVIYNGIIAAGATATYDLSGIVLGSGGGTGSTFAVGVNTGQGGAIIIDLEWAEKQ